MRPGEVTERSATLRLANKAASVALMKQELPTLPKGEGCRRAEDDVMPVIALRVKYQLGINGKA